VRDLAELVELNRFVGRELLLWLWFESEVFETNLRPSSGEPCALWLEGQLTLASEGEETRVKGSTPGLAPEAKQALRQGKLPTDTRLRMVLGELELSWRMKADELSVASLKIPAQLKADTDKYEALYERMRLTETFEAQLEALFRDFIALRLDEAWESVVVPELKKWARGKAIDEARYAALKARVSRKKGKA
jgi:hypothetical protein